MNIQKILLGASIFSCLYTYQTKTFELRAIIPSTNSVQKKIEDSGATFKGEYCFTDYIYLPAFSTLKCNI